MSITPKQPDGYYDENGVWQRTKFCFVDCGERCTCKPPREELNTKDFSDLVEQISKLTQKIETAKGKPSWLVAFNERVQMDLTDIDLKNYEFVGGHPNGYNVYVLKECLEELNNNDKT